MYVLFRKTKDGKQDLKTGKCRLVQRGHRRSSESGMNQGRGGGVDKVADDRGTEDLDAPWMKTQEKTALR